MWNGFKTLKIWFYTYAIPWQISSDDFSHKNLDPPVPIIEFHESHTIFIIYLFQLYMRWAMLPVHGFLQLEIYRHMHYMFPNTFYNFWSWLWLDRIQEYSLPYFLCHGSPPLSFGQADPPRSSKYWPCLDAAIPFSGFQYNRTAIASSWNWAP